MLTISTNGCCCMSGDMDSTGAPPPPPPHQKPLPRLIQWSLNQASWLTWLLCLTSISLFGCLPFLARPVFFDENALLAGNVLPTIKYSQAHEVAMDVYNRVHKYPRDFQNGAHVDYITRALTMIGVEVSVQTFKSSEGFFCHNVHGILQTPRGDGKEAMVLVTPLALHSGSWQGIDGAATALTLGYGMQYHLSSVEWLAKNFIWVITDARCGITNSMSAWLEEYQAETPHSRRGSRMFLRGGVLQQAVVFETTNATFNAWEVSVEGRNGELPLLDIYWLPSFMVAHVLGLPSMLGKGLLSNSPICKHVTGMAQVSTTWGSKLESMVCFLLRQAIGVPTGSHAAFKPWSIDAVTVRPISRQLGKLQKMKSIDGHVGQLAAKSPENGILGLLECTELMFRSCNSLLERLHHSYFYYLLTNAHEFVTVDILAVPVILMLFSLAIKAADSKAKAEKCDEPPWKEVTVLILSCHVFFGVVPLALRSSCLKDRDVNYVEVVGAIAFGFLGCVQIMRSWNVFLAQLLKNRRSSAMVLSAVSIGAATVILSGFISVNWGLTFFGLVLITPMALSTAPLSKPSRTMTFYRVGLLLVLSPFTLCLASIYLSGTSPPTAASSFTLLSNWYFSIPPASLLFWSAVYVPIWILCTMAVALCQG